MLLLLSGGMTGGGPSLTRPTAPAFTVTPLYTDGEATITLTDLPSDWGDATAPGDGIGEAGILQWWNPVDGWQALADPIPSELPEEYPIELPEALWGTTTTIRVRGVNDEGVNGAAASQSLAVPGGDTGEFEALWGDEPTEWGAEPALWGA